MLFPIAKLTWEEVQYSKSKGYYMRFKQQKMNRPVTLPILQEAFEFWGVKEQQNKRVFYNLKKCDVDRLPPIRINDAAIEHVAFHCFCHTHATLQIAAGTGILR
jgi:hypothetical protein